MSWQWSLGCVLALSTCAACGGSDEDRETNGDAGDEPGKDSKAGTRAPDPMVGTKDSGADDALPIAEKCRGIDFEDIRYSPGGNALPNSCEPFNATTNNPYAVRCVDAWPWYETRYPGDQYCILPPPPDKGVQFGFHPHGDGDAWFDAVAGGDMSGYQDLANGPWELAPGMETDLNYVGGADNPQENNYYRTYIRMRVGSHHMINSIGGATRGTWSGGNAGGLVAGDRTLPSAQRPDENRPTTLAKPAEDDGLYKVFPARPNITFNAHHFNSTSEPILRESWVNIWWEDDATLQMQPISAVPLSQLSALNVPPGTTLDLHYSYSFLEPTRVLELFGHRHVWTPNFTAWLERPGGETEIVFQSFDWFDMPTYRYDSLTKNPAPSPDDKTDGATSGVLTVEPGEELHFNCHIAFTDERAAAAKAPAPAEVGNLRFANQAFTAEMCILFGWSTVPFGPPTEESVPPPSFATVE
jgi:hypothetical protein